MNGPIALFLSGDVMTGRGIDQILPFSSDPVLYESYVKNAEQYVKLAEQHSGPIPDASGFDYIWGDALLELKRNDPDARIINLETAVTTNNDPWPHKRIHYRLHPGNVNVFTEAGINICVLGNNHILDWGYDGLRDTLQVLQGHDLKTAGAGPDSESAAEPALIYTGGGRLLVFSYGATSAGVPKTWHAKPDRPGVNLLANTGRHGIKQVRNDVDTFRKNGDRVLISLHWGGNWGYDIPASQRRFAHRLTEAGTADLIHGHSSHHPKGIEVHNQRLILYGCGDLINDYEGISGHEEFCGDLSLMYFPELYTSGALRFLSMTPMKIHRFQLIRTDSADTRWLAGRLNRECKKLGTTIRQTADGRFNLQWKDL